MAERLTLRQIARKYNKAEIRRLAQQRTGLKTITKARAKEMGLPWPLPRGWQVVAAGLIALDQLPSYKAAASQKFASKAPKAPKAEKREPKGRTQPKDPFYSSWEWKKARYEALARFQHRCQCCGWQPGDTERGYLVVDHIKSRRKHPELSLSQDNLQVLCNDCNMGKGSIYEDDFRSLDNAYKLMTMQ